MTTTRAALTTAAAALTLLLAGCTGDDDTSAASAVPTPTSPRVLQPGLPGEPAVEVTGAPAPPAAVHTQADVDFARGMVVHHAQALEMADLAPERASSDRVRLLADRIRSGQGPEIAVMGQWLADRDALDPATAELVTALTELDLAASEDDATHGGGHASGHGSDHSQHPGMATEEQLAQLRAARGEAFDRLFLTLMVRHHEGALEMVRARAVDGADVQMEELGADIGATQTVEIDRMRELLAAA